MPSLNENIPNITSTSNMYKGESPPSGEPASERVSPSKERSEPSFTAPEKTTILRDDARRVAEVRKDIGTEGSHTLRPLPTIIENTEGLSSEEWRIGLLAWHHKLDGVDVVVASDAKKLVQKRVIDGYATLESPGEYKEYEAMGLDVLFHRTSFEGVLKLVQEGAIFSFAERLNKGEETSPTRSGASDLNGGGANSVFLSMRTSGPGRGFNTNVFRYAGQESDAIVTYKSRLLDRIDWYAYDDDEFGRTTEDCMANRPTPQEFFQHQFTRNNPANELMFPHGVANDDIGEIVFRSPSLADEMIQSLRAKGISTIAGKPLAEVIISNKTFERKQAWGKIKEKMVSLFGLKQKV